jgi:hypothetical protein
MEPDFKISPNLFNPFISETFEPTSYSCSIQFGSGPLEGVFGRDSVAIKDGNQRHLKVEDQAIGLTTNAAVFDDSFDCIVGLAYPSMAAKFGEKKSTKHVPIFDSIIGQKLLDHNVFAFYLGKNNSDSTLTFGWVDKTRYTEPLVWHPVVNKYFGH